VGEDSTPYYLIFFKCNPASSLCIFYQEACGMITLLNMFVLSCQVVARLNGYFIVVLSVFNSVHKAQSRRKLTCLCSIHSNS
jgi:hypothetical protein